MTIDKKTTGKQKAIKTIGAIVLGGTLLASASGCASQSAMGGDLSLVRFKFGRDSENVIGKKDIAPDPTGAMYRRTTQTQPYATKTGEANYAPSSDYNMKDAYQNK